MRARPARLTIPATLTVVVLGGTATVCTPAASRAPADAALDVFAQTDTGPWGDVSHPMDTRVDVTPIDIATDGAVDGAVDGAPDVHGLDASQPASDVIVLESGVVCIPPPVVPDAQLSCGTCYDPDGGPSDCQLCPFGPDGGLEPVCGIA